MELKSNNTIFFSFLIVIFSGVVFTLFAPYFPIDETRYLTVAWEMKLNDSLIVPLLNGLPYSHKPPLLFWIINLDWFLLGVNEKTLRFIPILFSLANIVLVYRIALLLCKEKKIAEYSVIIFSSMLIYLIWSALIMFDVILTFWILLGIFGILSLAKYNKKISLLFITLSIFGGLLTKGPVIFLYIFPVSILYFLWALNDKLDMKKWYLKILSSFSIGILLALLWVIPAAMMGGEIYRQSILWDQTANRVVSSFAHQRPLWWYIPFLPVLFFPWILLKPAIAGYYYTKNYKSDFFLISWILSTMLLFSLISSKQIHYLIGVIPAVSIWMAKNIATYAETFRDYMKWHYPIAFVYIALGIVGLLFSNCRSCIKIETDFIAGVSNVSVGIILLGGILLLMRVSSINNLLKIIALSSVITIMIVLIGANKFLDRYDVKKFAQILKKKQEEGYEIVHYGKYSGQYQFLGRLTQPLIVLNDEKNISEYIKTRKKFILITYEKKEKSIDKNNVLYQKLYKGRKVILWENPKLLFRGR